MEPPLFEGEPAHCSLCGEAGHTHDDHWLFQHEPVIALRTQLYAVIAEAAVLLSDGYNIDATADWKRFNELVEAWLARPEVIAARADALGREPTQRERPKEEG